MTKPIRYPASYPAAHKLLNLFSRLVCSVDKTTDHAAAKALVISAFQEAEDIPLEDANQRRRGTAALLQSMRKAGLSDAVQCRVLTEAHYQAPDCFSRPDCTPWTETDVM